MRWKKLWSLICLIGLPWGIITLITGICIKYQYIKDHPRARVRLDSFEDIKLILIIAGFAMVFVFILNLDHLGTEIGLFTWLKKYKEIPPDISEERKKAKHKKVPEKYLSSVPDQFPVAKQGKKYVQFQLKDYLSAIVFGSPGSGKSVLILSMILHLLHKKPEKGKLSPSMFVFDFKNGELYYKSCFPNQKNVRFVSLNGRKDWGWNILYRLDSTSSDDDIIREFTLIADVLIDSSNEKNAFFTESAKVIYVYVSFYCYKCLGLDLISSIDFICNGDIKTMLKRVIDDTENRGDMKKVRDSIAEYVDKDNNEALDNVKMNLKMRMSVFRIEDIRWALKYNPRKASPYDLENGKSIFFYPGDVSITDTVMKIVAKQLEYHCRHRDFLGLKNTFNDELRQIIVVADECYTIGKLVDWTGWCSVARGFHTNVIMVWQSYSQIKELKNEAYAESLLDDVAGILVLAAYSESNAAQYAKFANTVMEERRSFTVGGQADGTYNRSFESKEILTPQDIMQLRGNGECLILQDGFFYIAQTEGARYYNIPELNEISKKCLAAHRAVQRKEGD